MKRFSLSLLLLVLIVPAFACEICGCGNNNFQIGVLPSFRKGFAGVRYSYASFNSRMRNDASEFSRDRYQTMELWGGYQFGRLQLMAFLPYYHMQKLSDDGSSTASGIGDAMILANYKIFSITKVSTDLQRTIRNEIFIGGGVKFATGVNRVGVNDPEFNLGYFNSQPGTGSTDVLATLTHNLLWNNSGIVTNLAYRFNGSNAQDFRFGNALYETTSFFHTFRVKQLKLNPMAGMNIMINGANRFADDRIVDSNGYVVNAVAGLNVVFGKFGLLANTFIPIRQNIYDGQTKLVTRSTVGVTFSF